MNTPYTSIAAMEARYGAEEIAALTDSGNNIAQLADDANALIDSYLPTKYAKPLTVIPTVLTAAASDIARWYAYRSGGPETVETRYKEAMAFIEKRLATGLFELPIENLSETGGAYFEARKRVFDRQSDYPTSIDMGFDNAND